MDKWLVMEEQLRDSENVQYYELEISFRKLEIESFDELLTGRFSKMLEGMLDKARFTIWQQIMQLLQKLPYQKGHMRRSFRAPNNPMLHNHAIIEVIRLLLAGYAVNMKGIYESTARMTYDNGAKCYVNADNEILAPAGLYKYALALLLDEEDEETIAFVEDVLWKNGAHLLFDYALIQAIMMSENEEVYKLLANVFKAAQSQEGVRQAIVENIDSGTFKAQCFFTKLLVENDFVRFSSVIRAVDVWFGFGYEAKDKKKVQHILELVLKGLKEGEEALLESDNAQEVYVGLWLMASQDVELVLKRLPSLLKQAPHIQHVTLYALSQLGMHHELGERLYDYLLEADTLQAFALAYPMVVGELPYFSRYYNFDATNRLTSYHENHPWLMRRSKELLAKLELVEQQINGEDWVSDHAPFPFLAIQLNKGKLRRLKTALFITLKDDVALEEVAAQVPKWAVDDRAYFYHIITVYKPNLSFILQALKDRSSATREDALDMLDAYAFPLVEFADAAETLLKQKSGTMRQAVIKLLKKQPLEDIKRYASHLLTNKNEMIRLGSLELLVEIKDDIQVGPFIAQLPEPTEKEQHFLSLLEEEAVEEAELPPIVFSFEFDKSVPFTLKQFAHYDLKKLREKFGHLQRVIEQYANETYEVEMYTGTTETRLIGNNLTRKHGEDYDFYSIDGLPLAEVWTTALKDSQLTSTDLYIYYTFQAIARNFHFARNTEDIAFNEQFLAGLDPESAFRELRQGLYMQQISTLLEFSVQRGEGPLQKELRAHFDALIPFSTFANGLVLDYITQAKGSDFVNTYYEGSLSKSREVTFIRSLIAAVDRQLYYGRELAQLLYTNQQLDEAPEMAFEHLSQHNFLFAHELDMVLPAHLRYFIEHKYYRLLDLEYSKKEIAVSKKADEVRACVHEISADVIAGEIARGDLEAPLTGLVSSLGRIYGIDYFVAILTALGNEKLSRNYVYSASVRKDSLSTLLEKTQPDTEEAKDYVFKALEKAQFTDERLIEAMLYNTTWLPLLSEFVGWKGLANVAWYFVAHTSEYSDEFEKAHMKEYSAIEADEFEDGAFDRHWFLTAYDEIGPERFAIVYEAAKYSASGGNHRRAQMYAKATLGELDGEELRSEIEAKRNKDKLRAYSLLPVDKEQATERYMYFQKFAKESKKFGAQRRASETKAAQMAIANLAQQVGRGNVKQFMWEMELSQWLTKIQPYFEPVEVEDVTLQLVREGEKVVLQVSKQDKLLKNVPARLKKHPIVMEIQEAKKEATEQYRRARSELEEAMCEEAVFDSDIVKKLLQHSLLRELLTQLVWKQGEQFFYLTDDFYSVEHHRLPISGQLMIAHPAHFYAAKNWRQWQHFVYNEEWQQPFKQLFREFYVATADELEQMKTTRFEGHQIQPKKAVALLRARKWEIGYYEPVRQISYAYNVVTYLDFTYDDYTPADVEAPTIGTVYFAERMTGNGKKIESLSPVYFSEMMRDLDLVASVAHVGEVDPEASHSTVEIRAVIAEEVALLFGFDHITVKSPHVLIDGQLGSYSLHLGSGHVHQQGGTMIPIATIPSQHRGRVFLPFVDEDPKTAEIMAKLLLFAQDDQINDPKIRQYITQ